ncbi:hypothetical protein ASC99_31295 [Kitasatospora sp. Root107]|nr:hypothetical protein ASC99_31295 [Kitasatospora sp. Root107]
MVAPPSACSGAMYSAVPSTACEAVIFVLAVERAIPKSVTVTRSPLRSIRLEGLRSRCTTSRRCAASSASSVWATRASAREGGIAPSAARISCSGCPSINSMTM